MTWEAITALGSVASAVILAATGVFIAWQVRAASQQMDLSKRSLQLDGMMRIMAEFETASFKESQRWIIHELDASLADPSFDPATIDPNDQPWRPALSILERLGVYIRFGYLDGGPFYYNLARVITQLWGHLRPLVEMQRVAFDNPYVWKDTEWLAGDVLRFSSKWIDEHPLPRPSTGEPFRPEHIGLAAPGRARSDTDAPPR